MDQSFRLLGQRIRERRGQLRLSRRALAAASGVSERFIAQVENGEANLSLRKLFALAQALGRSPSVLLADLGAKARSVCLVGVRGAGKSCVGRALAERLGYEFVEVDARIAEAAGLSLAEIFSLHGEAYYQRLQASVLRQLLQAEVPHVLAIGGSVVNDRQLWASLLEDATVIWLRADAKAHWDRVVAQGDTRPMAENPDAFRELETLLATRQPEYKRAHITIDTTALTVEQVANAAYSGVTGSAVAA